MNTTLPMDTLKRAVSRLPGGGTSAARQAALAAFARRGFPTLRHEDWKYTDLGRAIDISRAWLAAGAPAHEPDFDAVLAAQAGIDAYWVVIANGDLLEAPSTAMSLPGVRLKRAELPETSGSTTLSDLNTALARDALELDITAAHRDDKPIALLIADNATSGPTVSQVRLAIRVAAGAAATIIEYHVSSGTAKHYANVLIELELAERSRCRYLRLQERASQHSQTARLETRLAHNAVFEHFAVDLGGELVRSDVAVDIQGHHAEAVLNGVYLAGPGQHVDNHTRTDHRVGPARSRQEYRGVLAGRSRAVWNGKAIVHRGADGTDAEQANHNLLLSTQAEVDAKPELEIYADDVKCAHGTTIGQLDERAVYYLRTRGIDKARATRILTQAFAAAVIEQLPIVALRDYVGDKVKARLRSLASGETA